jgi:hypothetical protein
VATIALSAAAMRYGADFGHNAHDNHGYSSQQDEFSQMLRAVSRKQAGVFCARFNTLSREFVRMGTNETTVD